MPYTTPKKGRHAIIYNVKVIPDNSLEPLFDIEVEVDAAPDDICLADVTREINRQNNR